MSTEHTLAENLLRLQSATEDIADAITEKGGTASYSDGLEAMGDKIRAIPNPQPVLTTKTIVQNGTYIAEEDEADGYSEVSVDVSGGGGDIQFSHSTGYTSSSSSTVSSMVNVYSPSSCTISGASTNYTSIMIPIITTNSNVFICIPVYIAINRSARTASVSYIIPSNFPSKYGYNASTMTLHSYYNFIMSGTGNCTVSASKFNFSVDVASSNNLFGDFILKFDKT